MNPGHLHTTIIICLNPGFKAKWNKHLETAKSSPLQPQGEKTKGFWPSVGSHSIATAGFCYSDGMRECVQSQGHRPTICKSDREPSRGVLPECGLVSKCSRFTHFLHTACCRNLLWSHHRLRIFKPTLSIAQRGAKILGYYLVDLATA